MGVVRRRAADRAGRPRMRSPGRPSVARREERQRFWRAIAAGCSSEEAAGAAGVSAASRAITRAPSSGALVAESVTMPWMPACAWPVAAPADVPGWPRLPSPVALLYIFFQLVPASVLGALIGYADEPLYRWYVAAPRVTGLSALDDQLLGALIMWVGGGFYWLGAITVVFFLWSRREEDEARGDSLRRDLTPVARR